MKETADLIVFCGQSNMVGESGSFPDENPEINGALEYKYNTDSFEPVNHPCGEFIQKNTLIGAVNGQGGLMPYFCDCYVHQTKHKVIAVHAAKGSTVLSQWLKGGDIYPVMTKKVISAKEKLQSSYALGRVLFVWLQGESDAIASVSESEYFKRLISFKNDILADLRVEKFMIIRVGRYNQDARDDEIIHAQIKACALDSDFLMLTTAAEEIMQDPENINPFVPGHYSNKGYQLIGEKAGAAAANYVLQTDQL